MPLNPIPSFPSERGYVLRVAVDAASLRGHLEHINSGARLAFGDADELVRVLRRHLAGHPVGGGAAEVAVS